MDISPRIISKRDDVWAAMAAVMQRKWGAPAIRRLARESGVSAATISRIKAGETSFGLDVLMSVADALHVEAWQLLAPSGAQGAERFSPQASDLARSLDQIQDQFKRAQAYALAMHAIQAVGTMASQESPGQPPAAWPSSGRQDQN